MQTDSFRTRSISLKEIQSAWHVVDAKGHSLGRLASVVARYLMGKHKTSYTPHMNDGDHVIVLNASEVRLGGRNWTRREHFSHTGYPGGQRRRTPEVLHKKSPTLLVEQAVRRMLPKNRLGQAQWAHLHVCASSEHPHAAQKPKVLEIK